MTGSNPAPSKGGQEEKKEPQVKDFKITDEYMLVEEGTGIREAAKKLLELQKGVLLIKNQTDVIGVVFDKCFLKALAENRTIDELKVENIMDTNVVSVLEDDKFSDIVSIVELRKPAAIVVKGSDGKFRGYFSPVDFKEAFARGMVKK